MADMNYSITDSDMRAFLGLPPLSGWTPRMMEAQGEGATGSMGYYNWDTGQWSTIDPNAISNPIYSIGQNQAQGEGASSTPMYANQATADQYLPYQGFLEQALSDSAYAGIQNDPNFNLSQYFNPAQAGAQPQNIIPQANEGMQKLLAANPNLQMRPELGAWNPWSDYNDFNARQDARGGGFTAGIGGIDDFIGDAIFGDTGVLDVAGELWDEPGFRQLALTAAGGAYAGSEYAGAQAAGVGPYGGMDAGAIAGADYGAGSMAGAGTGSTLGGLQVAQAGGGTMTDVSGGLLGDAGASGATLPGVGDAGAFDQFGSLGTPLASGVPTVPADIGGYMGTTGATAAGALGATGLGSMSQQLPEIPASLQWQQMMDQLASTQNQNSWVNAGLGVAEMAAQNQYRSDLLGTMNRAVDRMDPFYSQRGQYAQQFNEMNSNPNWMQNDAVLNGINNNAIRNVSASQAAKGYMGSGNMLHELTRTSAEATAPYALQRMRMTGEAAGAFRDAGQTGSVMSSLGSAAGQAGVSSMGALGSVARNLGGIAPGQTQSPMGSFLNNIFQSAA